MQHFSSLDVAGLWTFGVLFMASLLLHLYSCRRTRRFNRKVIHHNYREIGFKACKPAEGQSICQTQR